MENTTTSRRLTLADRAQDYRLAAENLANLCREADHTRDLAITAIGLACDARLRSGLYLAECKKKFAGEFDLWLENYCQPICSRATAYRWLGKVRDLQIATGKEEPTFDDLKRAMLAADLLPEPQPHETPGNDHPTPFFRLRFDLSGEDPEKWQPAARLEFLDRARPVVELYERVKSLPAA